MTFGTFLACVSYGLGINPAAVPLFRKRFSQSFPPTVFHRLFDRISHGLGIDPSSFLMRSLGDVRHHRYLLILTGTSLRLLVVSGSYS